MSYFRTNGSGNHEERMGKLEAARREMEDALVAMAHLETKNMLNLLPAISATSNSWRRPTPDML